MIISISFIKIITKHNVGKKKIRYSCDLSWAEHIEVRIIKIYFLEKKGKEWQIGIKYLNEAKYILQSFCQRYFIVISKERKDRENC